MKSETVMRQNAVEEHDFISMNHLRLLMEKEGGSRTRRRQSRELYERAQSRSVTTSLG